MQRNDNVLNVVYIALVRFCSDLVWPARYQSKYSLSPVGTKHPYKACDATSFGKKAGKNRNVERALPAVYVPII